jgi:hypothetical protein
MIFLSQGSSQGKYERGLLNHLLMNYNVLERPVANESDPLVLSFGLTLMQIIDVVSARPITLLVFLTDIMKKYLMHAGEQKEGIL